VSVIALREVVGAILLNERGEVLLQQRDNNPTLRYSGYWTFFGGAVEAGEEPDQAIERELWEELEIELPLKFWMRYECPARTVSGKFRTVNHVYVGRMTYDIKTLRLLEGQAMRYFTQEESLKLTLAFLQSPVLASFWNKRQEIGF
jgi:8-oxo-dGTP diphosphatase